MCISCAGHILDKLEIPMMVENSTDPLETAFTISVDAKNGTTTGVSISDRLKTIKVFVSPTGKPEHLIRPGHMFPLRARDGLLKDRSGHTEASVTLMKMAGLKEVAVISEVMNNDGTMARLPDLEKLAIEHHLRVVSIADIKEELGI